MPPGAFFASIVAALLHFSVDFAEKIAHGAASHPDEEVVLAGVASTTSAPSLSLLLVMLAAALPVIGTGVRTYRLANELGRNVLRFKASAANLDQILGSAEGRTQQAELLVDLHQAEQLLEIEHREWLRLMLEAEWYG